MKKVYAVREFLGEIEIGEAEVLRETDKFVFLSERIRAFHHAARIPKSEAVFAREEAISKFAASLRLRYANLEAELESVAEMLADIEKLHT